VQAPVVGVLGRAQRPLLRKKEVQLAVARCTFTARTADRDARKPLLPLPVGQGASPEEVALAAAPSPRLAIASSLILSMSRGTVTLAAMQR
jgi:hypothetical protein